MGLSHVVASESLGSFKNRLDWDKSGTTNTVLMGLITSCHWERISIGNHDYNHQSWIKTVPYLIFNCSTIQVPVSWKSRYCDLINTSGLVIQVYSIEIDTGVSKYSCSDHYNWCSRVLQIRPLAVHVICTMAMPEGRVLFSDLKRTELPMIRSNEQTSHSSSRDQNSWRTGTQWLQHPQEHVHRNARTKCHHMSYHVNTIHVQNGSLSVG